MKRFIAILAVVFGVTFAASAEEKAIEVSQLPKAAQEFISTHFGTVAVLRAHSDKDILDVDYEVRLEDGTEIDFDSDGEWMEVKNKHLGISKSFIPEEIVTYAETNYAKQKIVAIDRGPRDYEIELSNGLELTFSIDGQLVAIDD